MKIERYQIEEEKDLAVLKEMWNQLETGPDMTAFQRYEWHRFLVREWTGWRLHRLYSRVLVYTALADGAPLMLVPVIVYTHSTKTKYFGQKKGVYLLGHGSYSDYLNVVCAAFSGEVLEAVCDRIREDHPGLPLYFTNIREDSALCAYLTEKGCRKEEDTLSLSVKRKANAEEYAASLSKKVRANLRKAMNRIERDQIRYEIEYLDKVTDPELVKEMVDIHIRRMITKNTQNYDLIHTLSSYVRKAYRKYRDLHNNIIAMSMQENPDSLVVLIRMNGKLVGYHYALREAHALRLLQTCFDEEYSFYSPLFRATYDFILQCYEDESILEVDFTRGDEIHKYRLGGEETMLYRFTL